MKNRMMTLALAACLLSSLAFADNPTDAPLVVASTTTSVAQQTKRMDHNHYPNKKHESLSAKTRSEKNPTNNPQAEPGSFGPMGTSND
jgi:hypothetical protein